jgi:hypothetical protein
MTSLQELKDLHTQGRKQMLKNYGPATKEEVVVLLEQAKSAKTLYDQFYSLDAIVNRYNELITDNDVKVELRKFEPILRLIKAINMDKKYTEDELNQLYDNCTEFFTNNLLTS